MHPPLRRHGAVLIVVLLALAAGGFRCTSDSAGAPAGRSDAGVPRTIAARVSKSVAYRACAQEVAPDAAVPRTRCGTDPAAELAAPAPPPRARRSAAGALQDEALDDLLWSEGSAPALARAIENLRAAAALSPNPAPALADLSAAYLERAEMTQQLGDVLEAVEAADSAAALEPRNPVALFNLALALDRLGLEGQAASAWERYLEVDDSSGWGREAAERRRALVRRAPPPSLAVDASPAKAAAFAARYPQEAREQGWERVLDEWGDAVLRGDSVRARRRLELAGALGAALARGGGDGTLAQAVAAIRGAKDGTVLRRLAGAHRAYAAGQRAYQALDHAVANAQLARADSLGQGSRALVLWAQAFRGATLYYLGKAAAADSLLEPVAAQVDTTAAPALAARVRWHLGTLSLRGPDYQRAQEEYRVASRLLHRLNETENVGALDYCLGEAEFARGNEPAADSILLHGLSRLRDRHASRWLHTILFVVSNISTATRLHRAEAYLRAEDVSVAARTGLAMYRVEAGAARVRFLARGGRGGSIDSLVEPLRRLPPSVADPGARAWALNDVRLAAAAAALHRSGPAAALDSAVAFYANRGIPLLLIPALQTRAEARLARHDADGATTDLDSASTLLAKLSSKINETAARITMLDRAGQLFERLAMLRLAEGREDLAFAALERGRATLLRGGGAGRAASGGWRPASPPGEVVVSYALVGDTLLTWTLAGTTLRLERSTPGRERLLRTLARVRAALERGAGEDAVRGDLAALYDVLLRPVKDRLGERLVVVADGEIASAPFAALWDGQSYLVHGHQLRFASSVRDAQAPGAAAAAPAGPAVLVADPAFDTRAFPFLDSLAGARAEVDSIAPRLRGAKVLAARDATTGALLDALPRAGLLHFAGHAVFDDDRPERSFLLLAPSGGDDGRLTAARIESLRLPRLRLVVLAACRTQPGHAGRSGGFAGLSGALLGAGARGVVGSLWRSDDTLTVPLMVAFHRAYARDGNGAAALREAQLAMLRSGDAALRSPAAWAGFRYAGR